MLASIPSPPFNTVDIGFTTVHVYGILVAAGVVVAVTVARRRYAALGGDPDVVDPVATWAIVLGFLGARAAYVSTHLFRFEDEPWKVLAIWEGGLALFGGLTAGALAALWALRRRNADVPAFADAVAVAIPLAQAIGRWGNYFNQELFGTPTTLPWAVEIDPSFRPAAYADAATFHPTFLYESVWNLLLAGFLWRLGQQGRLRPGSLMLVYVAGYGTVRFLLELIRTDTTFRLVGLSRNGWVSLLAVAAALVWLWRRERSDEADDDRLTEDGEPATL